MMSMMSMMSMTRTTRLIGTCLLLLAAQVVSAQSPLHLVPVSGVLRDPSGAPRTGVVTMNFGIYAEQAGGVPLWLETQTVELSNGRYAALLGATQPDGLPAELFLAAEPRWLGVQVNAEPEHTRLFWASVPYAVKAVDAETVGGLPVSAFVLTEAYRHAADSGVSAGSDGLLRPPSADVDGGPESDVQAPQANDIVHADDVIITFSLCIGNDCVDGEDFSFTTLLLKENNLRIRAQDTSVGAFPSRDWQVEFNASASGASNYFGVRDCGESSTNATDCGGSLVFAVEAPAGPNSLYVDGANKSGVNAGKVGFGTSTPVVDLHDLSGNTPTLRLDQNGSSGFSPQAWDLAGNETSFFIRDVTNGSKLPFRIRPNAPNSSLDIQASGNIGIGRGAANYRVQIHNDTSHSLAQFTNVATGASGADGSYFGVLLGDRTFRIMNQEDAAIEMFTAGVRRLTIANGGNVGIGTQTPNYLGQFHSAGGHALVQLTNTTTGSGPADGSYLGVLSGGTDLRIINQEAGAIQFFTSGAPRMFIGAAGVRGVTTGIADAIPVVIDSAGQLGTVSSSRRYKEDVLDMGAASEGLMRLRPVTFRYTQAYQNGAKPVQYGLIAEEVAEVFPDVVVHNADGQVETVQYDKINAMLLNEVQRLARQIQALESRLEELEGASAPKLGSND
jgi:hypothetical protein